MQHQELELATADGQLLYAQQWLPQGIDIRGVVCLVHGMGEHSGRYHGVAEVLTAAGWMVMAHDQRGHGRSGGKRGHAEVSLLTEDAVALVKLAEEQQPHVPRFLYGHSMGGNVALSCALRRQPAIAGVILTSPWLRLAFEPPAPKLWAGGLMSRMWPSFSLSTGLREVARAQGLKENIMADELSHDRISARMFFSLYQEGEWMLRHAAQLQVPLLLVHGNQDYITSHAASHMMAQTAPGCTFISVACPQHELHHSERKEELFGALLKWLDQVAEQ